MKRLVFPCGAHFEVSHDDSLLADAHRAKDGAYRIGVYPGTAPYDHGRQRAALCTTDCPNRRRKKETAGWGENGLLRSYVSCHARLFDGESDITPLKPERCPHCEEQRTFEAACRGAAKRKEAAPDRMRWRKCPQCGEHRELYEDTGLCSMCQL